MTDQEAIMDIQVVHITEDLHGLSYTYWSIVCIRPVDACAVDGRAIRGALLSAFKCTKAERQFRLIRGMSRYIIVAAFITSESTAFAHQVSICRRPTLYAVNLFPMVIDFSTGSVVYQEAIQTNTLLISERVHYLFDLAKNLARPGDASGL